MEEHGEPTSPGVCRVQLKDCIEELLKFTLSQGTLGIIDLGLSKEFCSNLLNDDPIPNNNPPNHNTTVSADNLEGVPQYPLYKPLASALNQFISSGSLRRAGANKALIPSDSSFKRKEEEWNQLILEKGAELVNVFKSIDFELHVQEPFISQLKDGLKVVEGRCAIGDYNRIGSGAMILFNKSLVLQVQDVHHYSSFFEMLKAESLNKVLPGVETIEEGVQIYRKFYTEEKERSNGVIAICVTKPTSHLDSSLASILSELSYEGVQKLLGFTHTAGTVREALPPPGSALLSSFMLPHNPDVKDSTLSDGARALAKHVNRSSDEFWGSFNGSVDVIVGLIGRCCWLNMHIVPPHGAVFEIRVSGGYGARWSEDGTKFIGFLEPYMEDGHSKGWKH